MKYAGSEVASTSEVLKYTLFQIFGRIDRPEAPRGPAAYGQPGPGTCPLTSRA